MTKDELIDFLYDLAQECYDPSDMEASPMSIAYRKIKEFKDNEKASATNHITEPPMKNGGVNRNPKTQRPKDPCAQNPVDVNNCYFYENGFCYRIDARDCEGYIDELITECSENENCIYKLYCRSNGCKLK